MSDGFCKHPDYFNKVSISGTQTYSDDNWFLINSQSGGARYNTSINDILLTLTSANITSGYLPAGSKITVAGGAVKYSVKE